jgi:DNA-binding winged helix-turn-helix (wHTH) protein
MADRRMLRYLLSRQRHVCSRDELLDAFWPDVAPDLRATACK